MRILAARLLYMWRGERHTCSLWQCLGVAVIRLKAVGRCRIYRCEKHVGLRLPG